MTTTPTFQSAPTQFHANPFDVKGRKVSAHIESADLINSLTTVDGSHTHFPESKSFHNVPRSAHSIYNESEFNHSRILPEQTHFQSPTLSEISHHHDFPKSAGSSSGFNYFTNMRNSAPNINNFEPSYRYRESSLLLNSPANNLTSSAIQQKSLSSTLPSHTSSHHKTLSSVIGDIVERDREDRRLRELQFTEDLVKNKTTMSSILQNEGRWMKELKEVDSLLKSCKEFSEAATRKRLSSASARWSEPFDYQYRPSPVQDKAYRHSENVLSAKPGLYKEECEDYLFNVSLRRSRENSLKNLKAQNIKKEVEEDAELRHRKDMFYMEESIRAGTTITDMVKNERQRELDLKLSQSNMQYIKEDCASKVLL